MNIIEQIQYAVDYSAASGKTSEISMFGKKFAVSVNRNLTHIRMELLEVPYYVARGTTPIDVYTAMMRYVNW